MRLVPAILLLVIVVVLAEASLISHAAREFTESPKKGAAAPAPAPPKKGGAPPPPSGNGGGGFPGGFGDWPFADFGGFEIPTSMVCEEKGPCYKKKLACPARCFRKWKNASGSGGGGSCNFDCKKCTASC